MLAREAARRLALTAIDSGAFARMLDALERVDPGSGTLTVLTYHRVEEPGAREDLDPALLSATPDELERHVGYLARTRNVLSLDELLAVRAGRMRLPRRAVMVTFDDATVDFAAHAWPVLRRHGLPVTLFVPTAYPGRPERAFWWDRVHRALEAAAGAGSAVTPLGRLPTTTADQRRAARGALRAWVGRTGHDHALATIGAIEAAAGAPAAGDLAPSVLDWDALRALRAEGVALAAHTRSHPCLDRITLAEAAAEVLGSLRDLEHETGAPAPRVLAFPGGRTTDALVKVLAGAGLEAAFTTERGGNPLRGIRWLRLRRVNVGRRTSIPVLRTELLSFAAPPSGRAKVVA